MAMGSETHPIWAYFVKLERDDRKISKCHLCYSELSGHLAGNAKKHLLTRHGMTAASETPTTSSNKTTKRAVPNQLKRQIEELTRKVDSRTGCSAETFRPTFCFQMNRSTRSVLESVISKQQKSVYYTPGVHSKPKLQMLW